ncbi:hypothetical protein ACWIGI_10200 [Nocardia sp. NPDC055321]
MKTETDSSAALSTADPNTGGTVPVDSVPAHSGTADKATRTLSIRLSTVFAATAALAAVVAIVVLSVLLVSARGELSDRTASEADQRRAEQVATDYAVGAATVNYQDGAAWLTRLKANTVPELAGKFDATAPTLQEVLGPLQWVSTAQPIAARVTSETGGRYQVEVFVNVTSTNAQSPQGGQTTVTYTVTVDRDTDWKIADVGGLDGALRAK